MVNRCNTMKALYRNSAVIFITSTSFSSTFLYLALSLSSRSPASFSPQPQFISSCSIRLISAHPFCLLDKLSCSSQRLKHPAVSRHSVLCLAVIWFGGSERLNSVATSCRLWLWQMCSRLYSFNQPLFRLTKRHPRFHLNCPRGQGCQNKPAGCHRFFLTSCFYDKLETIFLLSVPNIYKKKRFGEEVVAQT